MVTEEDGKSQTPQLGGPARRGSSRQRWSRRGSLLGLCNTEQYTCKAVAHSSLGLQGLSGEDAVDQSINLAIKAAVPKSNHQQQTTFARHGQGWRAARESRNGDGDGDGDGEWKPRSRGCCLCKPRLSSATSPGLGPLKTLQLFLLGAIERTNAAMHAVPEEGDGPPELLRGLIRQ